MKKKIEQHYIQNPKSKDQCKQKRERKEDINFLSRRRKFPLGEFAGLWRQTVFRFPGAAEVWIPSV